MLPFLEVMHTYFRGEKTEALGFILPLGLALVLFGLVAVKAVRTDFAWGAAIPAILFGLILTAVGIGVGSRTSAQSAALEASFHRSPVEMAEAELPRMKKVNRNFHATFIAFGVSVAAGLVLVYGQRASWAQGVGASLILVGALGLLVDGSASRRALPYTAALESLIESEQAQE